MKAPHPWLGQSPEIVSGVHHRRMGRTRFVPVAEDRIGLKAKLGPAIYLHEFLTSKQTDRGGRVNYGKPVGYAWIRAQWPGDEDKRPSQRTLERWMATLKSMGLARVTPERFNAGMRILLVGSVKFAPLTAPAPEQIPLLGAPLQMPARPVENPVETVAARTAKSGRSVPPVLSAEEVKKKPEETNRAPDPRASNSNPADQENRRAADHWAWRQGQKTLRLLREIESLRSIYQGAQDPAALARRDARLGELYEQLKQCHGVAVFDESEARAG